MTGDEIVITAAVFAFTALIILYQSGWLWRSLCWLIVIILALSGLAALFSMLASIIHFQILAAVGYFLLTAVLWFGGAFFTGLAQR